MIFRGLVHNARRLRLRLERKKWWVGVVMMSITRGGAGARVRTHDWRFWIFRVTTNDSHKGRYHKPDAVPLSSP